MTDTPRVVVPHSDFLERRDRRQRVAAELARQRAKSAAEVTTDVEAAAAAVARVVPPSGDDEPKR